MVYCCGFSHMMENYDGALTVAVAIQAKSVLKNAINAVNFFGFVFRASLRACLWPRRDG